MLSASLNKTLPTFESVFHKKVCVRRYQFLESCSPVCALISCYEYNTDLVCPLLQTPSLARSGQVRSECLTCTFRASCCSARLSRAQVPAFAGSSVRDRGKKGEGIRGTACTGGYKGVRAVRPESVAGGG